MFSKFMEWNENKNGLSSEHIFFFFKQCFKTQATTAIATRARLEDM